MVNALTIDWEYWWNNEYLGNCEREKDTQSIRVSTIRLLDFLDAHRTQATFFILCSAAEQHPDIVREICRRGHEIAVHGYSHRALSELGKEKFSAELEMSVGILQKIIPSSCALRGFRAPFFSLNNETKWALDILHKHGFAYDSSVFPSSLAHRGIETIPRHIYFPDPDDITKTIARGGIMECPISAVQCGLSIPVGNAFAFRVLPYIFLKHCFRHINKTKPVILSVHSWEMFDNPPRLNIRAHPPRALAYIGLASVIAKLDALLREFAFAPLGTVLRSAPALPDADIEQDKRR